MKEYDFVVEKEYSNIINWIRKYWATNASPTQKAIIGISGGKDSTIAAMLCAEALGKGKVLGVLMPQGVQEDIQDAIDVCKILGIEYITHNIDEICNVLYDDIYDIHSDTYGYPNELARINTPPRIRMTLLYAYAALYGGRVVNTCNLSEDFLGYSTKYGDMAGDFSPLGHYTVTEVIAIGEYCINRLLFKKTAPKELEDIHRLYPLVNKTPADGLCGKTDEENLGVSYKVVDEYIRGTGNPSLEEVARIEDLNAKSMHKRQAIHIPGPYPYFWK